MKKKTYMDMGGNDRNTDAVSVVVNENMDSLYEKAELDQLYTALKRSYTERFKMMTTLMKMDKMFRQAKITHKPFQSE
jgi:hypothetical protein